MSCWSRRTLLTELMHRNNDTVFRDKRLPQETSTCLEYVNNVKIDPHLDYYVNTETDLLFSVSVRILHVIFSHVQFTS